MRTDASQLPGAPRIDLDEVSVVRRDHWVFQHITYAVPNKTVLGVVGPTGDDMRAALLTLAGRRPADHGRVTVDGGDAAVAFIDPDALDPLLTSREHVTELAIPGSTSPRAQTVVWALNATGLTPLADRQIVELSLGQRLRVGFAAAVARSADVVAVDLSPVTAAQPDTADLWTLAHQWAATGRVCILGSPVRLPVMDIVFALRPREVPA